eukprot:GHVS01066687.1.p1 GENE.GHVS01066687.1~~GHVS01066687.1.p1  ORF type:complete len:147 (-),score=2.97 GHVS01066687.1:120-560(-)
MHSLPRNKASDNGCTSTGKHACFAFSSYLLLQKSVVVFKAADNGCTSTGKQDGKVLPVCFLQLSSPADIQQTLFRHQQNTHFLKTLFPKIHIGALLWKTVLWHHVCHNPVHTLCHNRHNIFFAKTVLWHHRRKLFFKIRCSLQGMR